MNDNKQVTSALYMAFRNAVTDLREKHREQFYYCVYGYDEYFGEAEKMLAERTRGMGDDELYGHEWETRLASMEEALRRLDSEGFFGTGDERKKVIVNAECAPPNGLERQRALRLNPESELLEEYLQFCEEEEE